MDVSQRSATTVAGHCSGSSDTLQPFHLPPPAMSTTSHVYLPPKLWLRVLRQHTEPEHLWTQCRQVSSIWRHEVQLIFRDRYLQDPLMTELRFHLFNDCRPMRFPFDRFDPEDECRCVFSVSETNEDAEVEDNDLWSPVIKIARDSRFRQKLRRYLDDSRNVLGGLAFPAHTVRVKERINDTELRDLRIDYHTRELSFQWLPMFECLFREENMIQKTMMVMQSLLVQELFPIDPLLSDIVEMGRLYYTVRKQVRRHRIRQWYKSLQIDHDVLGQHEYLVHEARCLSAMSNVMQEVRQMNWSEDGDLTVDRGSENDMKEGSMEESVDNALAQD